MLNSYKKPMVGVLRQRTNHNRKIRFRRKTNPWPVHHYIHVCMRKWKQTARTASEEGIH